MRFASSILFSPLAGALRLPAVKGLRGPEPDAPVPEGTTDQCTYYFTTSEGDDCSYVESYWGLSHDQFVRWNPAVKEDCNGIVPEHSYCVEVNSGGDITSSATTSATPTPTGSPVPSPTLDGTAPDCDAWHLVEKGDDCETITSEYSISMDQLMEWNGNVESDCSGLWADYYFCVSVENHEPSTTAPAPTPTGEPGPSPTPDGTHKECDDYHLAEPNDNCENICADYGITMEQLMAWNTQVESDCSGLWAEYYYCVSIKGHSPPPPTTTKPSQSEAPGPTQTGIVKDCQNWYVVKDGDNCEKVVAKYGNLNLNLFRQWNPAVGTNCAGLWLGNAYCVGTKSNPAKPPPAPPPPTGCQENHPAPTQPGALCKCKKWHKIADGDSCWSLANKYKVTEQQIKNWNPGTNCNMWKGYNVCVGI